MTTMVIDNGYDTPADRVFKAVRFDGTPLLIGAEQFSRFVLNVGALVYDSQLLGLGAGQPFDHAQEVDVPIGDTVETVRMLRIRLGQQGIPAGTYRGKLVCYDTSNPNGLVWARGFTVKVIDP